jgi:hypothetical protein
MEVCPAVMGDYALPRLHRRAETVWFAHIDMLKTQDFYCERQKGGQKRRAGMAAAQGDRLTRGEAGRARGHHAWTALPLC